MAERGDWREQQQARTAAVDRRGRAAARPVAGRRCGGTSSSSEAAVSADARTDERRRRRGATRWDGGQRSRWWSTRPASSAGRRRSSAGGAGGAAAPTARWRVVDRSDARFRRNRDDAMEDWRQGSRPKSDVFHGRPSILSGSMDGSSSSRARAGRQGSRPSLYYPGLWMSHSRKGLVYSCVLDSFHSICMNSIALDIVNVVLDIVKCCVYVLLDLLTWARHAYV
ncbi:hypothetical protein Scep_022970 [Stephania cephalantha]|uniref:Uncharacterized protein n=1 Tax=Stephania cephalantha TaxID=152367 RepID=A0AAP0I2K0_9MAGN